MFACDLGSTPENSALHPCNRVIQQLVDFRIAPLVRRPAQHYRGKTSVREQIEDRLIDTENRHTLLLEPSNDFRDEV